MDTDWYWNEDCLFPSPVIVTRKKTQEAALSKCRQKLSYADDPY